MPAPINYTLPSIAGSPVVGQTLSVNPGDWTLDPGGPGGKKKHRAIAYGDGTVKQFNTDRAYDAEVQRLQEAHKPAPPEPPPAPPPRPTLQVRSEIMVNAAKLRLEAAKAQLAALEAEAQAFRRIQMEKINKLIIKFEDFIE